MKKVLYSNYIVLLFSVLSIVCFTYCTKTDNPIKFPKGLFPGSVVNLTDINSIYDDYNTTLYQINANSKIVFSSNRTSSGLQFDLEQANISFVFDQTNGKLDIKYSMTNDAFLTKLISKAKTTRNDFGPYSFFSSLDGFEYLLLSSENNQGNLDLYYLKNPPVFNSILPEIEGPYPIKLLNTSSDEVYICFDSNFDSVYFASNRDGDFNIFVHNRPVNKDIAAWFNLDYAMSTKIDSLNSTSDDKCPFVLKQVMIFASNRPGGYGGFDLYYSVFRKGKWSSPVNLGPDINTLADEYRPVIGTLPDFTNHFMIFSSNKDGGKGGFDLYFTGINFPK